MAVWLQAKVYERRIGLRSRHYAGSDCVEQRRCSCSMRLVALYKCYAFAFCHVGDAVTIKIDIKTPDANICLVPTRSS